MNHFSANSVSPSQQPQTGFRARISCPPSPAASAGPGPKVCRLESGSSSSTSFPRSLHETRGRASLAEGGGAQGTGGRGAAVPPTGPWRGSHTPHPGEVCLSVRDLQAAPPQSFGGGCGGPTLCCRRAANSTHPPGGCGGDARCPSLPRGVGPEKAEKERRESGSPEGPGIAV